MFESCRVKQEEVKKLFASAASPEEKYQVLMDLGKRQVHLAPEDKTEENRVHGCQSITYLKATFENGKSYFHTESDALISAGLGQILTMVYSGESPEVILTCPPTYLEELGIHTSLSPGRANGLASIFTKMKQEALKHYISIAKGQ
jgi:cysteine desulfuration protein SufE